MRRKTRRKRWWPSGARRWKTGGKSGPPHPSPGGTRRIPRGAARVVLLLQITAASASRMESPPGSSRPTRSEAKTAKSCVLSSRSTPVLSAMPPEKTRTPAGTVPRSNDWRLRRRSDHSSSSGEDVLMENNCFAFKTKDRSPVLGCEKAVQICFLLDFIFLVCLYFRTFTFSCAYRKTWF